jgi:ElaB/YqjD/DUF883 family membrane-anchored ribosome-binding protein
MTMTTNNSARASESATPDIAALRAEMAALAEQVTAMVAQTGKDSAAMARRVRAKASDTMSEMAEAGGQAMHSVGRELVAAQKHALSAARGHPYQSVAILFGLGALIVMLARR